MNLIATVWILFFVHTNMPTSESSISTASNQASSAESREYPMTSLKEWIP